MYSGTELSRISGLVYFISVPPIFMIFVWIDSVLFIFCTDKKYEP